MSLRPTISFDRTEAELRHNFAHFFCNHEQIVDDMFRPASKLLPKHRILRCNSDGTRVHVTLAHHDTAHCDQRCCAEAILLGSQQRCNDHVATGLELPIRLQTHSAAQIVHDKRLMSFCDTQFPWQAGMLNAGQW